MMTGRLSLNRARLPAVTRRVFLHRAGLAGLLAAGHVAAPAGQSGRVAAPAGQSASFRGAQAGEGRLVAGMRLRWCPPGGFVMGSPVEEAGRRADEGPVTVRVSRGFWMGQFEVTQGEWREVIGAFPDGPPTAAFGLGDDLPVYWINYPEADSFCAAITSRARALGTLPPEWSFGLPTEAQWEYACRAGTTTVTAFGDRLGLDQANFKGDTVPGAPGAAQAVGRATPVGHYRPNPWGLYDMHGNVFEWCRDWYHARLPGGTDPDLSMVRGEPNRDGSYSRCRRGGAWNDEPVFCRSALRLRYEPERRSDHIGFRIVAIEATP